MVRALRFAVLAVVFCVFGATVFGATVLQYGFDGRLGSEIPDGFADLTGNFTGTILRGTNPNSEITFAEPNPTYNSGGTSAQFYNDKWDNNMGDTFMIPGAGGVDFSGMSAFTIELFINPSAQGTGHLRRIFSEYIYVYMYLDDVNTLHAIRKWGPGRWDENITLVSIPSFPHDAWSHLAMVWDSNAAGEKLRVYVNGQLAGSAAGTSTLTPDSTASFAIGGYQREDGSTDQFFCGLLDEFRISNEALEPSRFLGAGAAVSFDSPRSGALETVSPAQIQVTISSPQQGQTYSVDYAVTGGTATGGGVDYSLAGACVADFDGSGRVDLKDLKAVADEWLSNTPGGEADLNRDNKVNFDDFALIGTEWLDSCGSNSLVFAPGEQSRTINIDIISDSLNESDETIELALSNPSGGGLALGTHSTHTYTIFDLAPKVSFATADSARSEGYRTVMIYVNLSYASSEPITVDYSVSGGTAIGGGVDYTLESGTLRFEGGIVNQAIRFAVVEDDIEEINETIILSLSNPTNAGLGENPQHTYTIIDNEAGASMGDLTWYHSEDGDYLTVNAQNQIEWDVRKPHQIIVRLPEQRLSRPGDVAKVEFMWQSDGADIGCDCGDCPGCFDNDVTCVAGTGDFRIGVFDADGEYVTDDGMGTGNSIFSGYKGYRFRVFPHTSRSSHGFVCQGESHSSGSIDKRTNIGASSLVSINNEYTRLRDIRGFALTPGASSLMSIRVERSSSSRIDVSITLNGVTYTAPDSSSSNQPQKIDVFAIMLPNARPYDYVILSEP